MTYFKVSVSISQSDPAGGSRLPREERVKGEVLLEAAHHATRVWR